MRRLAKDVHRDVRPKNLFQSVRPSFPQYVVLTMGILQIFQNEITEIKKENNLDTIVEFDKESQAIS